MRKIFSMIPTECFWQTYWINLQKKIMGYFQFNKVSIKHSNNVQNKQNAQKSMKRITLPYTNIVGKKKEKSQME